MFVAHLQGTGHGVGSFLNVHEGPQGISPRDSAFPTPLVPNMTVTDEPGYYEDGEFGIRIENQLVVKEVQTEFNFGGKKYFGFENLTVVPIQTKVCRLLSFLCDGLISCFIFASHRWLIPN